LLKKSAMMLKVETERQELLEDLLPPLVSEQGLSRSADALGVHKATLAYWLLKMGIQTATVALAPGEKLEITRKDGRVVRIKNTKGDKEANVQ
jgi:hypothetical protein